MNAHPETGAAGFRQNSAYRTTPALHVQTSLPLIILLLCSAAAAQGTSWALVETLYVKAPSGGRLEARIDWTAGTLTVTGEASAGEEGSPARQRLTGFRAARTAALAGLQEAVAKVRVDARTRVGRAMAASGPVRERVEQLAGDARVVSRLPPPDPGRLPAGGAPAPSRGSRPGRAATGIRAARLPAADRASRAATP